jgi:uncharacterized protein (TIGR02147 family)
MFQHDDYREILKGRLEERCRTNPRYSLRAFARDLDIASSRLSEVLRGKQGLSKESSELIAKKIGFSSAEQRLFVNMVVSADARSKKERERARSLVEALASAGPAVSALREDTFRIIEDWYHYAILELSTLSSFKSSALWIARRLDISVYEVEAAIERLIRLGLLIEKDGKWISTHAALLVPDDVPSESIRKFNRQILLKASDAISTQTIDEREIGNLTIAIDEKDLPDYKKMIRDFRRKMNQIAMAKVASKKSKPNQVYCMAIQMFRLTSKESTK